MFTPPHHAYYHDTRIIASKNDDLLCHYSPHRATASFADSQKPPRNSNLELYRIIVMVSIVAHHYVVNSGLFDTLANAPVSSSFITMLLFGAWGKTGINCFVLITGWFMCMTRFTLQKILKLYTQVTFYTVAIFTLFCFSGHETFHPVKMVLNFFPVQSISDGFTSCFLVFYLLIPFLNILVKNLTKRLHAFLLILLLVVYTIFPTFPTFQLRFNYVTWFSVLYILASYLRYYGLSVKVTHRTWGLWTLLLLIVASSSVIGLAIVYKYGYVHSFIPYFFISDSNKILALALGVASFMYFKDLKISQSRLINTIGGATFGVLLIHANSDAMRQWLWKEMVDCVGHYDASFLGTVLYAISTVLIVFIICAVLEEIRRRFIAPYIDRFIQRLYEKTVAVNVNYD